MRRDDYLTETGETLRINMAGRELKKRFGCKMVKLALDGGFTCPNRDGTCGTGGCCFCGSGARKRIGSACKAQAATAKMKPRQSRFILFSENVILYFIKNARNNVV